MIGYRMDVTGTPIAVTSYMDDAIGTVKMWSKTTDPPTGWDECDGNNYGNIRKLVGRFPVAYQEGHVDYGTLNNVGGSAFTQHHHDIVVDSNNPVGSTVYIDEGQWNSIEMSISPVDIRPPFCVVRFIERYDNSS